MARGLLGDAHDRAIHIRTLADHFGEEVPGAAPDQELEAHIADHPENLLGDAHDAGALCGGHHAVDHPRLTADLTRPPAGPHRDIRQEATQDRKAQEPFVADDLLRRHFAAHGEKEPPGGEQHERRTGAGHDPERIERDQHRRPVLRRVVIKTLDLAVPRMGLEQAQHMGNFDGPGRAVILGVRPGHDIPAGIDRAIRIVGVVMAFQRRQRRRLVLRHGLPRPSPR